MILLGIGFVEVMFLAISSSSDRNVIACIIIIGIIIYLITAFLLKEKNKVQLIQVEKPMFQIVEACFVLSLLAFTFVLNQEAGFQDNLLVILLLGLLYGCARLLGGRLCGIMAAGTGFFLFFYLSSAGYEIRHAMDVICFLFPYFAFLIITKKVTHLYSQQPFLIIVSYLMLAVLFALASVLNPFPAFRKNTKIRRYIDQRSILFLYTAGLCFCDPDRSLVPYARSKHPYSL